MMTTPTSFPSKQRSSQLGFSLVEIVLAMGIAGFSLTVLISLLPVGLGSFKASRERTVSARIFQTVADDLHMSSEALTSGTTLNFDYEGNPVDPTSKDRYFLVNIVPFPHFPVPGSTAQSSSNAPSVLTRVAAQVVANPGMKSFAVGSLIQSAPGLDVCTRPVYVAN
jgi:uncharacterized protein (TIGR02598 family)